MTAEEQNIQKQVLIKRKKGKLDFFQNFEINEKYLRSEMDKSGVKRGVV